MNTRRKKQLKNDLKRVASVKLIIIYLAQLSPLFSYANGGGPSQPEMQSFEAVGTDNMVNMFTGDFTYNIPLLDVGGYPINISYQSGIQMDQEASWVGLGWNINPGVVSRHMRGVPDDFMGDPIVKEMNMKDNVTVGVEGAVGIALIGFDSDDFGSTEVGPAEGAESLSLEGGLGISYNNYTGIGIEKSVNVGIASSDKGKTQFTGNLGLNSSSTNGLSVSANGGANTTFSKKVEKNGKMFTSQIGALSNNLGLSYNSRAGLQQVKYNGKLTRVKKKPIGVSTLFKQSATWNFGTPTYIPSINMPMKNFSASAKFKLGPSPSGWIHPYGKVGGYISTQQLAEKKIESPAYGYMHSEVGQTIDRAIMDFNREKDGGYSPNHPALPLANYTFDIYSVSGQGVGGSFRTMRNDVGYVFDAASTSKSGGIGFDGIEIGAGNLLHAGVDISLNKVESNTGVWTDDNKAADKFKFKSDDVSNSYEKFYFREAGERTVDQNSEWIEAYGGYGAVKIPLKEHSKWNVKTEAKYKPTIGSSFDLPSQNYKSYRDPRNQVISYLTNGQLDDLGLIEQPYQNNHPDHHIGEITVLQSNGTRYVYGIPAYNHFQKDVTFSVGMTASNDPGLQPDCETGLVNYEDDKDNTVNNKRGVDHFYSSITTPEYAHSYLLSAVLSSNYSDIDDVRGPSPNDLGDYTRFHYDKTENYKWRTPYNHATFNEGLKSDLRDDKASYAYGEKEVWYLDSIVTKNYIAVFHKEDRKDGHGVLDENGKRDNNSNLKLLRKISLYSLPEYHKEGDDATPLKEVHFEYDYSLCPNNPSNDGNNSNGDNADKGKLTLKKLYFTYQNSNKAKYSPYTFEYGYGDSEYNPEYNEKSVDRWGCYKPDPGTGCSIYEELSVPEYPYAEQNKELANKYSAIWNLTQIKTPAGGKVNIEYESDDYAFVQHKKAMQMHKVVGIANSVTGGVADGAVIGNGQESIYLSTSDVKNKYLLFELQPGFDDIDDYFSGVYNLYFRFLMNMHKEGTSPEAYDYVSGYARLTNNKGTVEVNGTTYGYVQLRGVDMGDDNSGDYNPISKAAIQYNRLHLPKVAWGNPDVGETGFSAEFFNELIKSSIVKNLLQTVKGANKDRWDNKRGRAFITNKSWIRLNNVNGFKYGGGYRVKKVTITDEWAEMAGGDHQTMEYGQEYFYHIIDGEDTISSGVAAYEPILGGEENPFRQPIFFDEEKTLAPDEEFYMEGPFGESFFPSPMVGYSKVTVRNLERENVKRHATGKTVHEYYTAKDFPTITERTTPDKERHKPGFDLASLFKIDVRDFMTASQGFSIELNDMHGKPKGQHVYQEDKETPITSTRYIYKEQTPKYPGTHRLDNHATVVDREGSVFEKEIGVTVDLVNDFRESKTKAFYASGNVNFDVTIFGIIPIPVPTVWPSMSKETTQYRSASTSKIINRFGILEEVQVEDLGSIVSTKDLAYDAHTGDVLLNETVNDFNDKVYSLNFPAYWHYDQMGQAYKNISAKAEALDFNASGTASVSDAPKLFSDGDEVAVKEMNSDSYQKAWVTEVNDGSVKMIDKYGNPINGTYNVNVMRSGRRNLMSASMASITTMENPLEKIRTNLYERVLNASAVEFSDEWRTHCDCIDEDLASEGGNPYVIGNKGNWLTKRSQSYLTDRTQSNYNNNTNIRKDGVFESYTPFYKLQGGHWVKDPQNWTFTAEVTEFSPKSLELESMDALNRYSATTYGYNATLATAVAANARHRELGFDGFEDYDYNPCIDGHFKFDISNPNVIVDDHSHTGRKSIAVTENAPVTLTRQIDDCELVGCMLELQMSSNNPGTFKYRIKVIGGDPAYTFDWTILSGNPVVTLLGEDVIGVSTDDWKIKVIVRDSEGCVAIETFEKSSSSGN